MSNFQIKAQNPSCNLSSKIFWKPTQASITLGFVENCSKFLKISVPWLFCPPETLESNSKNGFSKFDVFTIENRLQNFCPHERIYGPKFSPGYKKF